MKKRAIAWLIVLAVCLSAVPALAANVFQFTEKVISIFEGDIYPTELKREGSYDGEGEIVYASNREAVATVSQEGVLTAVSKGRADVTASLMRNGRRIGQAKITVNVLRAVNKVTLNTSKMSVYESGDPAVAALLKEPTDHQVIVFPAGSNATLATTCTPEDASDRKVTYTSTDAGIVKIQGTSLRALQRGECDLTVASVQNPEITQTFRVLVIQPVKKIMIDAGSRTVAAGSTLQLTAICQPDNASIQDVTWTSRTPQYATVDENGIVTGVARGNASIVATAADGSRVVASVTVNVTQPVGSISMLTPEVQVIAGRSATAKATVLPADASDKKLTWASSDNSIATVRGNGLTCQVTGVKAGTCTIYATSVSDPNVSASSTVVVSQLVTKIDNANAPEELDILVGQSVQTRWNIQPEDATVKELTFTSNYPKLASVDENGLVTGLGRCVVTIRATSKDAGKRTGAVRVNVIQPATGVSMPRTRYYIQRGGSGNVTANVEPKNANNRKIASWYSSDEGIATVRRNGSATGLIYGASSGTTYITAVTEDGGFTASTQIRVGNWNSAVLVEELYVDQDNRIRITMRNTTHDVTFGRIIFTVECYDTEGNPFICNQDGESTFFEATYPHILGPYERTVHGSFNFGNYLIDRPLGGVILTVTGWRDVDGNPYTIPESERVRTTWNGLNPINPGEGVG